MYTNTKGFTRIQTLHFFWRHIVGTDLARVTHAFVKKFNWILTWNCLWRMTRCKLLQLKFFIVLLSWSCDHIVTLTSYVRLQHNSKWPLLPLKPWMGWDHCSGGCPSTQVLRLSYILPPARVQLVSTCQIDLSAVVSGLWKSLPQGFYLACSVRQELLFQQSPWA